MLILTPLLVYSLSLSAKNLKHIKVGLWEVETKVSIPGMPFQMPAQKSTQCITEKDLPPKMKDIKDCKYLEKNISEGTIKWKAKCNMQGEQTENTGEMIFSDDLMSGHIEMKSKKMTATMNLTGVYKGSCKK